MYKFFWIILVIFNFLSAQNGILDSLKTIRAFQLVDSINASAGYVKDYQFRYLKEYGFTHIISLLPGDQRHEDSIVTSLGMTFKQIDVNWNAPSITNVQNYFSDMKKYSGQKVFLHCMANMRASAFMFLYRTTQLGVKKEEAQKTLYEIWDPKKNEEWDKLIKKSLEAAGLDGKY